MIKSKAWEWEIVKGKVEDYWKKPCIESYYLINRWLSNAKTKFLDLGCGLGRHSIQFAKAGFNTYALDLSEKSIQFTKDWAKKEKLNIDVKLGDMLKLPYEDEEMDCILCRNVIYHSDTEGIKKIVDEIYRVLKKDGECYLTLISKERNEFKKEWPVVDENTKIKIEDGPENGVPHFYADLNIIFELFLKFKIIFLEHIEKDISNNNRNPSNWHYHILIKKETYNIK
ncbi:MAG: class I SAM-dependent methyltransferase [Sphaerochaetaceae bacterium]|nr:class I SAM-dependent methyltransferase [Sphaerochaetaceae bacterium]